MRVRMARLQRPPRLTIGEFRDLGRACAQLAALDATLQQGKWQGAPACRMIVELVFQVVAGLYNRAEKSVPPKYRSALSQPASDAPEDLSASVAAAGGPEPGPESTPV